MQYFQYFITILFVDGIYAASCGCAGNDTSGKIPTFAHRNIRSLKVVNNNLLEIKRETFNKYHQLEELNVINSGVSSVADKAFYDLPHLREVNMSNNLITTLNSKIFRSRNKLCKFGLSFNMLSNLDTFDVTHFPELLLFDVANNRLTYLPRNLLQKLERDENFTLITENNPWDCRQANWSRFLNENLRRTFCNDSPEFLPTPAQLKLPPQSGFLRCIAWAFGAFWIGIITGNLCLLKRILFPRKGPNKKDQATQYDHLSFIHASDFIKSVEFKTKKKEHSSAINLYM